MRRRLILGIIGIAISVGLLAYGVHAIFTATSNLSTNSTGAPIVTNAATTTSPAPCNSTCPGLLYTGSPQAVDITDTNGLTGGWTSTGATPTTVTLVATSVSSCGTSPTGITVPQSPGTISGITTGAFNYCVYYGSIPAATTLTVTVAFTHP